jgi:hypothetical protein
MTGNVYVTNPQDIYQPIVDAIRGTGESPVTAPSIDAGFTTGENPVNGSANTAKQNLSDKIGQTQVKYDAAIATGQSKLESIQPLNLPTSLGTKTSFSMTLPKLGAITIDLAPYQSTISLTRALLLMVMLIGAWFSSISIIRSGIA